MRYFVPVLLLLSCLVSGARADHQSDAEWSWHLLSAGLDESRLSVYQRDRLVGIFDLGCDLTGIGEVSADEEATDEEGNAIDLVSIDGRDGDLLIVVCNVGAHSQRIEIFDLATTSTRPAFAITGSYVAAWEIQDDELWIRYDRACETGPTVECPDGYETIFVAFEEAEGS